MAVLRQAYLDAKWYARQRGEEMNLSLEAWNAAQDLPQIFEVSNWQDALRADKLGDEFDQQYVIRTGGDGYERLDALKASGATLIVPLDFPDAYDVTDPFAADIVSLGQLRHWERAPGNAAAIAGAGIPMLLTTDELKKTGRLPRRAPQSHQGRADRRTSPHRPDRSPPPNYSASPPWPAPWPKAN